MKNILLIDTSDNKKITVGVEINGKSEVVISEANKLKSQACLALIEKVLESKGLKPEDLSEIKINKGPGSFTGLRIGMAIANSFSYLLKIPVNGTPIGQSQEPVYN